MSAAVFVMALLALEALTERNDFPGVVCRPFLRFGALGRLFGRFFYPGWPSGTLFVALLGAVLSGFLSGFLAVHCMLHGMELEAWAMIGITLAILVFPAALIQLFVRKTDQRFSVYAALFITSWVLTFILSILYEVVSEGVLLWIFSPIPMMLVPLTSEHWRHNEEAVMILSWGLAGLYYVIVFIGAGPWLRSIGTMEKEELERLEQGNES
jgi:fluoride ion exporter CrcB/FEX